ALGYWRRPDLTAKTFEELPDGRRRVFTGDRGRRRPDGLLEHLGRIDHMVKVAGQLVDLGEVTAALQGQDGVADAVAVSEADARGDVRIQAYVVAQPGQD